MDGAYELHTSTPIAQTPQRSESGPKKELKTSCVCVMGAGHMHGITGCSSDAQAAWQTSNMASSMISKQHGRYIPESLDARLDYRAGLWILVRFVQLSNLYTELRSPGGWNARVGGKDGRKNWKQRLKGEGERASVGAEQVHTKVTEEGMCVCLCSRCSQRRGRHDCMREWRRGDEWPPPLPQPWCQAEQRAARRVRARSGPHPRLSLQRKRRRRLASRMKEHRVLARFWLLLAGCWQLPLVWMLGRLQWVYSRQEQ